MALTNINPDVRFQDSILQNELMTPTNVAGTPSAGVFHSSIVGRKSLPDMRKDLKPRMGIERIATQQIYEIQNEFGPNGEKVWGALGDTDNQIRFVGNWNNYNASFGLLVFPSVSTDYLEITFYGTGLNLALVFVNATYDIRYSVDGSSESTVTNFTPSAVISGRNYSTNQLVTVVANLSLGVHTVKIRSNVSPTSFNMSGFEVVNTGSQINVNPGYAQIGNKKTYLAAQSLLSHNSSFESGTLGSRGGRVVTYMKKDGTIAKAVQAVDASSLTFSSATHANEEIVRRYNFREFGVGRADDLSSLTGTASNRAFTLEDGTTTLVGQGLQTGGSPERLGYNTIGDYVAITFVGTGLDVIALQDGTGNMTVNIDGGSNLNYPVVNNQVQSQIKIVSGLPYGTHTVKFTRQGSANLLISNFVVYQPKKPSIPAGAIELADYNVMANYAITPSITDFQVPTGTVRKMNTREVLYIGAAAISSVIPTLASGFQIGLPSATVDSATYTFFGTGIEVKIGATGSGSTTSVVTIDGVSNLTGAGYTTSSYGLAGGSFVGSTGVLTVNINSPGGISITNIPLGIHTIRITKSSGAVNQYIDCFDVITPIHSYASKRNLLQNNLPIGSQGMSDNRKTSALEEESTTKSWVQAVGVSSGPTNSSTSAVPMPDMSCTITTNGGDLRIAYSTAIQTNTLGSQVFFRVYVNGIAVGAEKFYQQASSGGGNVADTLKIPIVSGTHKVDLYWYVSSGTANSQTVDRSILVEEV